MFFDWELENITTPISSMLCHSEFHLQYNVDLIAASKYSTDNDDMIESGRISETELFHRRRPPSKTMTTKSTMTNEDDYQMEITKSLCAENIEHSSQPSSVHEGEVVELEDQKEEEQKKKNAQENHQQKFLSWKMTPRVNSRI